MMRWSTPTAMLTTFCLIVGCAVQSPTTVTLVGQTGGFGGPYSPGYDEIGRMKSSSLREKLLRAIDAGELGVNDYVPADTSKPEVKLTALCAATIQGNVKTIEELIKRGAKVNQPCVPNGTRYPLDVVIEKDRKSTFYFEETIATLRAHGAQFRKAENHARYDQYLADLRAEAAQRAENRQQIISTLQGVAEIAGTMADARANAGKNLNSNGGAPSTNFSSTVVPPTKAAAYTGGKSSVNATVSSSTHEKRKYPLVKEYTFPTTGMSSLQDACTDANRKVDEHLSKSTGKLLSRGQCECKELKDSVYGKYWSCKVAVSEELIVDYDPNRASSNISR